MWPKYNYTDFYNTEAKCGVVYSHGNYDNFYTMNMLALNFSGRQYNCGTHDAGKCPANMVRRVNWRTPYMIVIALNTVPIDINLNSLHCPNPID